MSEAVDSGNRAHSIMGPECSYCGHRKRWHHDGKCTRGIDCHCVEFDDGTGPIPRGWLGMGWHKRVLRHRVEDLSTYIPRQGRCDEVAYRFRCSCGKEWVGEGIF
jgi:hypothetical protein